MREQADTTDTQVTQGRSTDVPSGEHRRVRMDEVKEGDTIQFVWGPTSPDQRPVLWYCTPDDPTPRPVAMADDGTWTVPANCAITLPPLPESAPRRSRQVR